MPLAYHTHTKCFIFIYGAEIKTELDKIHSGRPFEVSTPEIIHKMPDLVLSYQYVNSLMRSEAHHNMAEWFQFGMKKKNTLKKANTVKSTVKVMATVCCN